MSNRIAVMEELGSISIRQTEAPSAKPGQAIVRVEAVGVCGSDTAYFTVGYIGDYRVSGPIILGHEAAGVVVQIGDGVTNVEVGDRVAIEPGTPCRNCRECRAGRYHLCPDLVFLATPPYDGALTELLAIDARNLFTIPGTMSFEEAALLEPLSVGIWACRRANLAPGQDVLVTGAGPVGLLAAMTARAFGAARVVITDVSPFRLAKATELGIEVETSGEQTGQGFDVMLECSGAAGVLATGLKRLRPNGHAAMVGMSKEAAIGLPLSQLNPQELTISLVNRYNDTWPTAIALVASGRIDVSPLVTHTFGLDETADALTLAARTPNSLKAIIYPQR